MGAAVEAGGNGEKGCAEKLSNPVVYQLVRVEGDGRLVPATEDELVEVDHLLEGDNTQVQSVEAKRHPEKCPSGECSSPKYSDSEGLPRSKGTEVDSQNLNARVENMEVMLQKVKQEERLRSTCESVSHSPEHITFDYKSSELGSPSVETVASPTSLNARSSCSQLENVGNDAVASRSSVSETCSSSHPDFSILKGELCLDNLTIRKLQEVFRATFGRQTNVKDKLWLKRRIAMGITNSCEVSTTSIVIKENKVVQSSGSISDNCRDSPNISTRQIKDQHAISVRRLRKPLLEYDIRNENLQMEHYASKRARKPTKRYIEELSEVDEKEYSGRLVTPVKRDGNQHVLPKSRVKPVRDICMQSAAFVTRPDSIGGSGIQIPYVSRTRRGRPRKDYYALMNFGGMDDDISNTKLSYSEENQDLDHELINTARDTSSDNNGDTEDADTTRTLKVGAKRKHHRAWSLSEVLKLVEGVALYGAGRWSEIRRVAFASYSYRTSVDLKDKWRNLLRASFALESSHKGVNKNGRKPTSMPIPMPILLRVRELAEKHSQSGIEFGPSKFAGHGGRFVQDKGSGFL